VQFATTDQAAGGRRSSSAAGAAVLAAALLPVDPASANAAAGAADRWRKRYPEHFAAVTAAAGRSADAALTVAREGLAALDRRMCLVAADGTEVPLDALDDLPADSLETETIIGSGQQVTEIRVPYRGQVLAGKALDDQLQTWVDAGTVEPGFAARIRAAMAYPEWLAFPDRTVVVLGAGSAMGPMSSLLAWGARVVAVDLHNPDLWVRLHRQLQSGAGTVLVPRSSAGRGADLLRELPAAVRWLIEVTAGQKLVLGLYAYADGAAHVGLSAAAQAIAAHLRDVDPQLVTAYLATPTDAFLVPQEVVDFARARWPQRPGWTKAVHAATFGHAFRRAYARTVPGDDGRTWGLQRAIVDVQGPNYLLAKRAQRWRGVLDAHAGLPVSFTVAPSTWTISVTKNKVLAAAYHGAPRVGVEIFDEPTSSALLAAKLVADVHDPQPAGAAHPETLLSRDAAHGGLWRSPYEPESALAFAALLGFTGLGER
jgi:hypothetical protein